MVVNLIMLYSIMVDPISEKCMRVQLIMVNSIKENFRTMYFIMVD